MAGPPSAAYRLRKFVRRNRPQVIAAGLVLVALVAGIVGTTLGLVEARRQAGIAREERNIASSRLAKLENGVEILGSVFAKLDPTAEKRGGDSLGVALGKQLDPRREGTQGRRRGRPTGGRPIAKHPGRFASAAWDSTRRRSRSWSRRLRPGRRSSGTTTRTRSGSGSTWPTPT